MCKCIECGRKYDSDLFGDFCSAACVIKYSDDHNLFTPVMNEILGNMHVFNETPNEESRSIENHNVDKKSRCKDLLGQRRGKLTVIARAPNDKNRHARWLCRCDCGVEKIISSTALMSGQQSCGCEGSRATIGERSTIHGLYKSRLYCIWHCMKDRCYRKGNSKYYLYGGRGIRVCDEWLNDFMVFYNWSMSNGYRDDLTLDRIDSDGNYEPSNCRWATYDEQNKNRKQRKLKDTA